MKRLKKNTWHGRDVTADNYLSVKKVFPEPREYCLWDKWRLSDLDRLKEGVAKDHCLRDPSDYLEACAYRREVVKEQRRRMAEFKSLREEVRRG